MYVRQFKYLAQIKPVDRLPIIAEGLDLLAENTASLMMDAQACQQAGRPRGATLLAAYAGEEAAKAMMLLDLARGGWKDLGLLGSMSNHLARLIYVWSYNGNPANLKEVQDYADYLRQDLMFIDDTLPEVGRSLVLEEREEIPYVDYVLTYEEGRAVRQAGSRTEPAPAGPLGRWMSPQEAYIPDADSHTKFVPNIVRLLPGLKRAGSFTPSGLGAIADTWRSHSAEWAQDAHYRSLAKINMEVLKGLAAAGLLQADFTDEDARHLVEEWSFPLNGMDLKPKKVTDAEIDVVHQRWVDAQG